MAGGGGGGNDNLGPNSPPDKKYLLMVAPFTGNQAQAPETGQFLVLRTADNTVAFLPPSGTSANAPMATWARHSNRLLYRDAVSVRTWDPEVRSVGTLFGGLHWSDPPPSPNDRWLAYTQIDTQFVPRVKIYDLHANQSAT